MKKPKVPSRRGGQQSAADPSVSNPRDVESRIGVVQMTQIRQGPLPVPSDLREYDLVVPGFADRIMAQWERETLHRHAMERRGQWQMFWDHTFARLTALVVVAGCLGLIAHAIYNKMEWAAATIAATLLGGGALLNFFGPKRQRDERPERSKRRPE